MAASRSTGACSIRTALAEAEVEYEDHVSPSIWVKFGVVGGGKGDAAKIGSDVSAVIWTTTPWTLPHNRALAFHPDFEYAVVETEKGTLLLAADRVAALQAECDIKEARVRATFKGRDFEGMKFQHPFLPIQVPGVLAGYVTLDQGSGIVHTAPGHGVDDFNTGQKYGLETYAPLDDRGVYTEGLPEYKGKDVFTANPIIVKLLGDRGALLGHHDYKHSYPHCWRCHNPVIFRATEQWFIKMDQAAHGASMTLRAETLEKIRGVKWIPAWGEDRMYEMIAERPDWCVSRQRFWGVPIIVFYCDACGKRLEDFAALRNVVKWFEKEGADAWYKHTRRRIAACRERNAPAAPSQVAQGKRHSRRVVRFRLLAPRGAERPGVARRRLSRRPGPVSRLVPQLAADRRRHHATTRRTAASSRTAGRSTKRASRCRSRSATRCIPPRFANAGEPICCASGSHRSNIKPT